MKPVLFALFGLCLLPATPALAEDNGIVTLASPYAVAATVERLQSAVEGKGLKVFARIDHAGEAAGAGLSLRPAQLLIFGHPKAGTPLMNAAPTAALDLPLKALVWQDVGGAVWVSYNRPSWLIQRHGLDGGFEKNIAGIENLVKAAVR